TPIRRPKPQPEWDSAELSNACPLAAVVDLQTIATSPEKVDAILPPYREMAARVPSAPTDEAVPRIQYPVHIGSAESAKLRVAEVPRVAAKSSTGEWLIDPKEWLGSETDEKKPESVRAESSDDTSNVVTEKAESSTQPTDISLPES